MRRLRASSAAASASARRSCEQEHLDAARPHLGDELVVLVLRPLDPQDVVEQQVVVVRRRQPLEAQVRAVDHDLAQLADLGVDAELAHRCSLPRAAATTFVPGRAVDDLLDVLERPDGRPLAGRLDEAGGGVDLRAHRPGGEVHGPQLRGRDLVEPPLLGRAPVGVDAVDVGRHDEQVGVDLAGEQLAGEVLVDHGLDAAERAVLAGHPHRRDAAAAGADHDRAVLEQPADRADLEDALRRRRRHDAAEVRRRRA